MKSEKTYNLLRRIKLEQRVTIPNETLELLKQRELVETITCSEYGAKKAIADRYGDISKQCAAAHTSRKNIEQDIEYHNNQKPFALRRKALGAWEERSRTLTEKLGEAQTKVSLAEIEENSIKEAENDIHKYVQMGNIYVRLGSIAEQRMKELRVRLDRLGELDYSHFTEELIAAETKIQQRVDRWARLIREGAKVHEGSTDSNFYVSKEMKTAMAVLSMPEETSSEMLPRFNWALQTLQTNDFYPRHNPKSAYKSAAIIARKGRDIREYMAELRRVWADLKGNRWETVSNDSIADFAVLLPQDNVKRFVDLRDSLDSYYGRWPGLDKVCAMLIQIEDSEREVSDIVKEFTKVGPPPNRYPGSYGTPSYPLLASKVRLMGMDSETARERWDAAFAALPFENAERVPFFPLYSELAAFPGDVEEGIELFKKTAAKVSKASLTHKFELDHLGESDLLTVQLYRSGWVRKEIKKD